MRQFPHSGKAGRYHSPKSKDRELPNILSALAKCCSPSDRFPATKASLSCICYTTPLNKSTSLHWPRGQMNGRLRSTTSVDPFDFQLRIVAWTNSLDAYVQVSIDKLRTAQPPFCMIFYNSHPFRVAGSAFIRFTAKLGDRVWPHLSCAHCCIAALLVRMATICPCLGRGSSVASIGSSAGSGPRHDPPPQSFKSSKHQWNFSSRILWGIRLRPLRKAPDRPHPALSLTWMPSPSEQRLGFVLRALSLFTSVCPCSAHMPP